MNWRPASSVILLNTQIRHVLMMRRGPTAKFMPNSYVFPGGLMDKADYVFPRELSNFNLVNAQPILIEGHEDDYTFRITALRELFEEAGILLTFDSGTRSSNFVTEKDDPSLTDWRKKVVSNPSKFTELFSNTCLADVNLLIPWSNWLTPCGYLKRFDTFFFVAPVDKEIDSEIKHCVSEMSAAEWTTASKVIERSAGSCEVSLPPPQYYELVRIRLAQNDSLLEHSNPMKIIPQLVDIIDNENMRCTLLPGDHLYNELEPETTNVKRMTLKEVLPGKEIDNLRAFHRMTYRIKPIPYTGQELHAFNLKKMPYKMHLFHFAGDNHSYLS